MRTGSIPNDGMAKPAFSAVTVASRVVLPGVPLSASVVWISAPSQPEVWAFTTQRASTGYTVLAGFPGLFSRTAKRIGMGMRTAIVRTV